MKYLASLCILLWTSCAFADAPPPILIDVTVIDAMEGPYLQPLEFTFKQGQEYLMVIKNENNYSINFHYDNFGQQVFTLILQGTPEVFQTGFGLPSYSKVLWHFSPSIPGEYPFHVSNAGMNLQGKSGKILVRGPETSSGTSILTGESASEKSPSATKKSWFRSLRFWKKETISSS